MNLFDFDTVHGYVWRFKTHCDSQFKLSTSSNATSFRWVLARDAARCKNFMSSWLTATWISTNPRQILWIKGLGGFDNVLLEHDGLPHVSLLLSTWDTFLTQIWIVPSSESFTTFPVISCVNGWVESDCRLLGYLNPLIIKYVAITLLAIWQLIKTLCRKRKGHKVTSGPGYPTNRST